MPPLTSDNKFFVLNQKKKIIIASVAALVIALGVVGISAYNRAKDAGKKAEEEQQKKAVEELKTSVENTPETRVDVPSANPIKKVLPQENPLEKTNPFKNDYQNPFE